ncbi:Phosphoinositide phospholipase C [Heracleum sosnowskyi]|uniref:Phosphoinositide phospholipase C n=1 Tax=Heracleum sosnowskyi TaxID=360622 RepID=A0AAD8J379_9APIA|nr:Phosphoinositide phospholipase C [Heracleum sosnowskyi]
MGSYKMFGIFSRKFKTDNSGPPEDLLNAFNRYSDAGKQMSGEQLLRFLIEFQGEKDCTLSEAEDIIRQVLHQREHLDHEARHFLTMEDFCYLLLDDRLNPPIKHQIHQDMDSPLSHYFIYTGHNSYLTGNQLSSDCSDAPIIEALQKGVRVIELDIWPNSDGNDVNVLHGRTLTTPVKLLKCLSSIKEHAFTASEYPVVITLEDHLTPDLQAKVADMVTQTFGEALFIPDSESVKELASPNSLKKSLQKEKDVNDEEAWGKELSSLKIGTTQDKGDLDEDDSPDEEDDDDDKSNPKRAPKYRRLIAIHAGKGKGGLDDWLKVDPDKVRRLSLSEPELEKAVTTHGKAIVRFTQQNILRVYPKGIRFDSSNYNPLIAWTHGAQMVAFNMQGYGRSLWLMHGMFRANGCCGYVKKPDILLKAGPDNEVFNPETALPIKTTLKVTVYTGEGWCSDFKDTHYDAYSPPDFYARIGIAGVDADTVMKKSKTVKDTYIPNWNEEFEFPLTFPELALLRFEVHEYDMSEKDDFGGQTCLLVSELRSGIRAVPLHSKKGDKYNSVKVLLRFEFV